MSSPFALAALFMAAGIAFGRASEADPAILFLAAAGAFFALARAGGALRLVFAVSFLAGAALIWRHDNAPLPPHHVSHLAPAENSLLLGEVVMTDSVRDGYTRYLLRAESLNGKPVAGLLRWYASGLDFDPLPGDRVLLTGAKVRGIRGYRNIGGWDYERYMKDRGIAATVSTRGGSKVFLAGSEFSIRRPVEEQRHGMLARLTFENEDVTAAARAMTVGDRGLVTPRLRDTFSRAGTAHLLAISGLHVGFIAFAVYHAARLVLFLVIYPARYRWASAGVPMKAAAFAALLAVGWYAALVYPMFSARRAAVMVSIYLVAVMIGRGRDFYGAFAAALSVILITTPWALFDAGFQLSFVTVFFLVALLERILNDEREPLDRLSGRLLERLAWKYPVISGYLLASVMASIASAPLSAYHFNTVPMYGFAVNSVLVPLASVAAPWTLFSAITGSESMLSIAEKMMTVFVAVSRTVESAPGSYHHAPSIPPAAAGLFYVILALFVFMRAGAARRMAMAGAVPVFLAALAFRPLGDRLNNELAVKFLDVGQGDCSIAVWPEGALAIDGGNSYKTFDIGRSIAAPALWREGRTALTAMFATHGDADHIRGLPGLADRAPPALIADNGLIPYDGGEYGKLRAKAMMDGAYRMLRRGEALTFPGGVKVVALNPPGEGATISDGSNNNSLALMLVYGNIKILFAADMGQEAENRLLGSGMDIRADVLRVGHHGARTSASTEFLDAVAPKAAVISAGYGNHFGHPAGETLNRLKDKGIKVFRTDMDGEVRLTTDGKSIRWITYSDLTK